MVPPILERRIRDVQTGSGKRFVEDGIDTKVLKLVDTKTFSTGIVILTY
ncbi:MAG: hypothetical protein ACXVCO_18885 [Ktedonobacterales bacterium]